MSRRTAPVSASLLAFSLLAGCNGSPEDPEFEADAFETDDTRDLAKGQPVNGPPQYRTLWPAGDVDFVRFRVDEVDPDGEDENGPHYGITPPYYTAAVYAELWNDEGLVNLSADTHYRMTDGGFTVPGIYYLKLYDDGVTGGECKTWITFRRDGDLKRDLVATAMRVPMEVTSGEETTFGVWVVNQGGETAAKGFDVALYLSADGVTPVGGAIAEEEVGYDLGSGYAYDFAVTVPSFPATLTGPAYLIVVVDPNAEVVETGHEDNNVFVGSTLVDPATYDATLPADPGPIIPSAAAPTVVLRGRLLYPADDEDTADTDESDADEFELQLDAGLRYYEVWTENLVGWADPKIEILDAAGDPLDPAVEAEDGGLENGASYLLYDSEGASGARIIRVTDEQGNSGAYDLVVRASGTAPDRFEPDGGTRTWRVLREGEPGMLDGRSFSSADDQDWVAYPVSVDGWEHTILTYSVSGCDTKLNLYEPGGSTPLYSSPEASGAGTLDGITIAKAGLYYLRVTNTNGLAGGTYWLKAQAPVEP